MGSRQTAWCGPYRCRWARECVLSPAGPVCMCHVYVYVYVYVCVRATRCMRSRYVGQLVIPTVTSSVALCATDCGRGCVCSCSRLCASLYVCVFWVGLGWAWAWGRVVCGIGMGRYPTGEPNYAIRRRGPLRWQSACPAGCRGPRPGSLQRGRVQPLPAVHRHPWQAHVRGPEHDRCARGVSWEPW
jgi:hypothetical protein